MKKIEKLYGKDFSIHKTGKTLSDYLYEKRI